MTRRTALAAIAPAAAFAAALAAPCHAQDADFIWYGGPILEGRDARPEALAVKDGRIVALGARADVEKKWKGRFTLPIDLNGQALVAGIVASPAPPPAPSANRTPPAVERKVERKAPKTIPRPSPPPPKRTPPSPPVPRAPAPPLASLSADVSPPPGELPYTIASLRDALRMWILRSSLPKRHRIVLGFGYDETKLGEHRPPTREELDTVSATMPVIVVSKTGDAGAYNTIALQRAGISWRTKDPPGGVIRRRGRIQEPNGVLEGAAHAAAFARLVPPLDDKERWRLQEESVRLNMPDEPETARLVAAVVETPAPTPLPTPAPTLAPMLAPTPAATTASLPVPSSPRDAGSEALAALVTDVLAGKATLDVGRPADMSVLSDDPAAADPERRARLKVVEEVRKGRTVWRRDPSRR
jgi:hypothetical protein